MDFIRFQLRGIVLEMKAAGSSFDNRYQERQPNRIRIVLEKIAVAFAWILDDLGGFRGYPQRPARRKARKAVQRCQPCGQQQRSTHRLPAAFLRHRHERRDHPRLQPPFSLRRRSFHLFLRFL